MRRPLGIAVCRKANERPIRPGTLEGYACEICKEPLRLTVATARRVRAGELVPCCNACGVILTGRLEAGGHELEVMATPTALTQLAGRPPIDPLGDFFRARLAICAHCGASFTPQSALCVIANLQLALRHPGNNRGTADVARAVIAGLIERLREGGFPAHAELAELGNDPAHDFVRKAGA